MYCIGEHKVLLHQFCILIHHRCLGQLVRLGLPYQDTISRPTPTQIKEEELTNYYITHLTLQRGVTSTARHSVNITCRGVTSPARHAARSHSFVYISTS